MISFSFPWICSGPIPVREYLLDTLSLLFERFGFLEEDGKKQVSSGAIICNSLLWHYCWQTESFEISRVVSPAQPPQHSLSWLLHHLLPMKTAIQALTPFVSSS